MRPQPSYTQPRRDDRAPTPPSTPAFQKTWIVNRLEMATIDFANAFGAELKNARFTTSQIRNFFGEVRRIQQKGLLENRTAFLLLLPKLAYAAARAEGQGAKRFEEVFKDAILAVNLDDADSAAIEKRFQNFCDFFEAVLAYHKKHGGK